MKELRLRDISAIDEGNAFAPEFIADFNARFARAPHNSFDAHRPLLANENLDDVLTWKETRQVSASLTVSYQRRLYLLKETDQARALAGKAITVFEFKDSRLSYGSARGHFRSGSSTRTTPESPRAPSSPTSSSPVPCNKSKSSKPSETPTSSAGSELIANDSCCSSAPPGSARISNRSSQRTRHLYFAGVPTFLLGVDTVVLRELAPGIGTPR